MKQNLWRILCTTLFASLLILGGCSEFEGDDGDRGPEGPAGPQGDPGVSITTGTISGTVTNSMSSEPVEGVTVSGSPTATTDADGNFTLTDVKAGVHELTFSKENYESVTVQVNVNADETITQSMSLTPVAAVVVSIDDVTVDAYGGDVTLTASVDCYDGRSSCGTTWNWSHSAGAAPAAMTTDANTATVTLGSLADYKDHFFDELLGDGKFVFHGSNTTDRVKVHGVNPYSLEEGIMSQITVTAMLANGDTASATATVEGPHLPYDIAPGLRNVPINRVALMHGPNSWASYSWSLTAVPTGSAASISDADTQHAYFTPDVAGTYTLSVTDGTNTETMELAAGEWKGNISGVAADGTPESEFCTDCHNGGIAPDKFQYWSQSGHAHILTQNLNTSTHYGPDCFMCHTVGYDPDSDNGGIDEASDFQAWLDSGMFNVPNAENWANTVANYPKSARMANIQCENCHGPNDSVYHGPVLAGDGFTPEQKGDPRVSLNADVCGACHGETLRHARFQQWQEAGHSNAGLAASYGGRSASASDPGGGHCGRCHTGQGFLYWIEQNVTAMGTGDYIDLSGYLTGDDPSEDPADAAYDVTAYQAFLDSLGVNPEQAEPQTCQVCHKVHNPGTSSGEPNDVRLQITADDVLLLPGGFEASNLGQGGLCIACHNSRNGAHNDVVFDWNANNPDQAPANFMDDALPHGSAQGDVVMGENAFFVERGARAQHSLIENGCATCHMELTPPPAELSYNLSGTNHRFAATLEICSDCHGEFNGGNVQEVFEDRIAALEDLLIDAVEQSIKDYINDPDYASVRMIDSDGTEICSMTDPTLVDVTGGGGHGSFGLDIVYNGADCSGNLGHMSGAQPVGLVAYDGVGAAVGLMLNLPVDNVVGQLGPYQGQAIAKSTWNTIVLADDGSEGIHNPGFMTDVFGETEEVLGQIVQ